MGHVRYKIAFLFANLRLFHMIRFAACDSIQTYGSLNYCFELNKIAQRNRTPEIASCDWAFKATSHSTIFDIPMRPLPKDQKHRHRFTR